LPGELILRTSNQFYSMLNGYLCRRDLT
jgi:hypothetical protein